MKDLLLRGRVVVRTSNMKISRRHFHVHFSQELESGISKFVKFRSIFRTKKQILGLVNFNSRFLDLPSGVTAILN